MLNIVETNEKDFIFEALAKYSITRLQKVIEIAQRNQRIHLLRVIPKVLLLKPSQNTVTLLQILVSHKDLIIRNNAIQALKDMSDQFPLLYIDQNLIRETLVTECRYTNKVLKGLLFIHQDERNNEKTTIEEHTLIRLLKQKIDKNLGLIFDLLHIQYPPDNYAELLQHVKSTDNDLRNNAIEYVDSSLSYNLKSSIIPLLDFLVAPEEVFEKEIPKNRKNEIKAFLLDNKDSEIKVTAQDFFSNDFTP